MDGNITVILSGILLAIGVSILLANIIWKILTPVEPEIDLIVSIEEIATRRGIEMDEELRSTLFPPVSTIRKRWKPCFLTLSYGKKARMC